MKRSGRLRTTLIVVVALLVLVGGSLWAAHLYLNSQGMADRIAARLQKVLGGTVHIGRADVGLHGGSTLRDVEVYEEGAQPGQPPWIRVKELDADVSALSFLRGESTPETIRLRDAQIILRFDRHDHLLTRMATGAGAARSFPRVRIEQGQLTIEQEDHEPMVIPGITADLTSQEEVFKLDGTITNPDYWGNWKAQGSFDSSRGHSTSGDFALVLDTDHAQVNPDKLHHVAFVPKKVWKEVEAEGVTPCHFTLNFNTHKKGVTYTVQMEPRDARVQIPSIDLKGNHASGKVVVKDEVVTLEGVKGELAGGTIATSGVLDFASTPDKFTFKVNLKKVRIEDLPESWKKNQFVRSIRGDLTGKADLVVTYGHGKVHTTGTGQGEVTGGYLVGPIGRIPIAYARFKLVPAAGGKGFDLTADGAHADAREATAPPEALTAVALQELAVPEPAAPPADAGSDQPGAVLSLIEELPRGVSRVTHGMSRGASAVLQGLTRFAQPAPAKKTQPGRKPATEYMQLDLGLQDVQLPLLLEQFQINLPVEVTGRLSFQFHIAIPIDDPRDFKSYRFNGTMKLAPLHVAGLEMSSVTALARYRDGVLDLQKMHGELPAAADQKKRAAVGLLAGPTPAVPAPEPAGTFDGSARYQVTPPAPFTADLKINHVPLDTALARLPHATRQAEGVLSGDLHVHAPANGLRDPAAWQASGSLRSPLVRVYGLGLADASVNLNLDRGVATLGDLKATLAGAPLTGSAEVRVTGKYPYKGRLTLEGADLAALNKLVPAFKPPVPVGGKMTLNADLRGTAEPFTVNATGTAKATGLTVNKMKVNDLSFAWAENDKGLSLDDIKARLYQGRITGSALLPMKSEEAGNLNLKIKDVDIQGLAGSLPHMPVRLQGRVSGSVKGEVKPTTGDRPRKVSTDIEISAPQMRVQGIPTQKLQGSVDYHAGVATYHLQGEALGGRFKLNGRYPPPEAAEEQSEAPGSGLSSVGRISNPSSEEDGLEIRPPIKQTALAQVTQARPDAGRITVVRPPNRPPDGTLEVTGVRLSRLWPVLHLADRFGPLRGRFNMNLNYWFVGPQRELAGTGRFRIFDLRWSGYDVVNTLRGDVSLTPDVVQFGNVSGGIAGGMFRGRLSYSLRGTRPSWFNVAFDQVDANRLLQPFPEIARHVQGVMDVHLRGRIGPEISGGGYVVLTRARLYGLEINEWRVPIDFVYTPATGDGELSFRESNAHIAGGQALGHANFRYVAGGVSVDGNVRFFNVNISTFLSEFGRYGSYATGRMTGRVNFSGSDMHSVNDLTALILASFSQTQALQLPVLSALTPFLAGGVTNATTFQSGDLRARLAHGVIRVQRLALTSRALQLILLGNVTLAGRLDLDADLRTGNVGCLGPVASLLGLRIPAVGALPITLITQASVLLANQVVHLHLAGTIRNPIIQVQAGRILSEEAVRFFLLPAVLSVP